MNYILSKISNEFLLFYYRIDEDLVTRERSDKYHGVKWNNEEED